jgi:CheY-like chemotaxis protein
LNSFLSPNIENGILKVESMPPLTHPELKQPVLLCIDDNEDVLECEKSFLESFGYTVLTAATGSQGLELASMHSVDLVIVDYVMPEMNGHEVAIAMRRVRPQAPIIMLSGAVDVPEQALKWVDAFVAKDRLASQLLPAITQVAQKRRPPSAFV